METCTLGKYQNRNSKWIKKATVAKVRLNQKTCDAANKMEVTGADYKPKTCPICFEDIEVSDMVMACPSRSHYFHCSCLSSWVVHNSNPFEGRTISEKPRIRNCTCPMCRTPLEVKGARMYTYLRDKWYAKDDRSLFERVLFRMRIVKCALKDSETCERLLLDLFVICFGVVKGCTLRKWTLLHVAFVLLLPSRMRFATTIGFIVGLWTRGIRALVLMGCSRLLKS